MLRLARQPLLAASYAARRALSTSRPQHLQVTVCGGGNAAHIAAGMFTHNGADVNLYFSFEEEAKKFRQGCDANGGVEVRTKQGNYKAKPKVITSKPEEAIPGSDMVILITPAFAHEPFLKQVAPHLSRDTFLGAIPGPGGFDLLAQHTLGPVTKQKNITLFGAASLPWACRTLQYGASADLLGEKSNVPVTLKPDDKAKGAKLTAMLNEIHDNTLFPARGHFLVTTLWPTNCVIHPGISYGIWHNWDGKPLKEPPLFYQNCDAFTGNVLDRLSDEIMDCKAVIETKLKVDMSPLLHIRPYMLDSYGHVISDKSATHRIFATNDAFRGLKAPTTQLPDGTHVANYNMRYFTEDLPHGLAVLRNIGELCGVKTPMMDTVLEWAQARVGREYLVNGKIQGKDVAHSGCPARFGITTLEGLK